MGRTWISILSEGKTVRRFTPLSGRLRLGRREGLDIAIPDTAVSAAHAELSMEHGVPLLKDLGSLNGLKVNGIRRDRVELHPGTVVVIGRSTLTAHSGTSQTVVGPSGSSSVRQQNLDAREAKAISFTRMRQLLRACESVGTQDTIEDAERAACRALVGEPTRAEAAWVLRVGVTGQLIVQAGATRPSGDAERTSAPDLSGLPLTEQMIEDFRSRPRPMLGLESAPHRNVLDTLDGPLPRDGVATPGVLLTPIDEGGTTVRALCVVFGPEAIAADHIWDAVIMADRVRAASGRMRLEEERRRHERDRSELGAARAFVMNLLPSEEFAAECGVALSLRPCNDVGGDCIDLIRLRGGRQLLVLADVVGHGLQAAMVGIHLNVLIREHASREAELGAIVKGVSRALADRLTHNQFATAVFVAIDRPNQRIELFNAGHPYPMLINRDGELRLFRANAPPLMYVPPEAETVTAPFGDGDHLVLYSDGLDEVRVSPGPRLGHEAVRRLALEAAKAGSPRASIDALEAAIEARRECPAADDEAVVWICGGCV